MSSVITRQLFCERCFKAGRPYSGLQFIVIGSKGYHLREVERWVSKEERGFTPHLVSLYKPIGDNDVAIMRVCGMLGCGLSLEPDKKNSDKSIIRYLKVSYDQISLADWNSLVLSKDFGYKI